MKISKIIEAVIMVLNGLQVVVEEMESDEAENKEKECRHQCRCKEEYGECGGIKEDLGDYEYCCEEMARHVTNEIIKCNPHSGEHYIQALISFAFQEVRYVNVFLTACPFCGSNTFERQP